MIVGKINTELDTLTGDRDLSHLKLAMTRFFSQEF